MNAFADAEAMTVRTEYDAATGRNRIYADRLPERIYIDERFLHTGWSDPTVIQVDGDLLTFWFANANPTYVLEPANPNSGLRYARRLGGPR